MFLYASARKDIAVNVKNNEAQVWQKGHEMKNDPPLFSATA